MRSGRGMFIVFIMLAALVVACSGRTQGGGSTSGGTTGDGGTSGTTSGGTTAGGGTTGGGTSGTTGSGTTGGGTTSGGGTTGGGTDGGTSLTGTWEGQVQITVLLQSTIPKPPPVDYPGQLTTIDIPCSMGGDLRVQFAQNGSQIRIEGHGSTESSDGGGTRCQRVGDIQGTGTVNGDQLNFGSLDLLGCTVSFTATINGDNVTGSVIGTGALPPACRVQAGEVQLHRSGSS